MGKRKSLYIIIAVLILALSIMIIPAIADAGSFSGGSDYGGGGGWSGGSDWGSSDGGSYFFSSGSDGSVGGGSVTIIIIVLAIVFAIYRVGRKAKGLNAGGNPVNIPVQEPTNLQSMASLKTKDPNFSEADIKENISNLYVRMQNAWQAKDFEPMRPYMTDAIFNQFSRQLEQLVNGGMTNYVERIAVLSVTLDGWAEDEANDTIVATVNTRITDYTLKDDTGKLVSGSQTAEKFMCYKWTLIRSKGTLTPERAGEGSEQTVSVHCPSCGAPTNINHSAKCEYCGSIINAKDYDWSISAIRGVSQQTRGQ